MCNYIVSSYFLTVVVTGSRSEVVSASEVIARKFIEN